MSAGPIMDSFSVSDLSRGLKVRSSKGLGFRGLGFRGLGFLGLPFRKSLRRGSNMLTPSVGYEGGPHFGNICKDANTSCHQLPKPHNLSKISSSF